jgi:hypothetical protein
MKLVAAVSVICLLFLFCLALLAYGQREREASVFSRLAVLETEVASLRQERAAKAASAATAWGQPVSDLNVVRDRYGRIVGLEDMRGAIIRGHWGAGGSSTPLLPR